MKKTPKQIIIAAIESAAMRGDRKAAVKHIGEREKITSQKPRDRKRPEKMDRWRGDEKTRGGGMIALLRTEAGRSKLKEAADAQKKRWSILGSAEDAEKRLIQYAVALRCEWTGCYTDSERETPAERDLSDAAYRLHCVREAHKRSDLENASCHLYALGQFVERLRGRVLERFSRLGKAPKREFIFKILDDAHAAFLKTKERGVLFSAGAIWGYASNTPKMAMESRANWFTEWKKARGL